MLAVIPTDPPGRRKIDHREALCGIGISHSSINGACVSARQIFSGGCGIWRSTTSERVAAVRRSRVGSARAVKISVEVMGIKTYNL
jgi:hypothetical protein